MKFFKLIDLTEFYFTKAEYTQYGYSILDLYNYGYTVDELYQSGYSIFEIYNIPELKSPNSIGIDFLKSNIPIIGTNGLIQIMNTTTYPLGPLFNYYTNPLNNNNSYEIQRLFQIYNIADLYSIGFGISFMKYNNIPIFTLYPLIQSFKITYIDLKNGDNKNGFINKIGYTLFLFVFIYNILIY